ncbi:MAG: T9SS type A sorting domain-containing protein [Chitinophagales bacterium]|nr:T9SS type A sorting domain-containing protein [Chitinophagales bacterium]
MSSSGNDAFTDAIESSDGGVLVVGYLRESVYEIEIPEEYLAPTVVIKKNADLENQWVQFIGGSDLGTTGHTILEDEDGSIYCIGTSGANTGDILGNNGVKDIFITKLTSEGDKLWTTVIGSTATDEVTSAGFTSTGDILITGYSFGDGGDIPYHYASFTSTDVIYFSIDTSGNLNWLKVFGGTGVDQPVFNTVLNSDGNTLICIASSSADFDLIPFGLSDNWKFIMMEVDADGNTIYSTGMDNDSTLEVFEGAMLLKDDSVLVFTTMSRNTDLAVSKGIEDGAIVVFTPELELDRMYNYGGSNYDYLLRAIYEPTKHVYYVLGSSYSVDQDLPGNYSGGIGDDFWLMSVDEEFNLLWSRNFGGANDNSSLGDGSWSNPGSLIYMNDKLHLFTSCFPTDDPPDFDLSCTPSTGIFTTTDGWRVTFDLLTMGLNDDTTEKPNVRLYPNPASGLLFIDIGKEYLSLTYTISSLTASIVQSGTCQVSEGITIDQLPSGLYFITLETEDRRFFVSTFCKI